ncbi:hypothetical protein BO70DRAFT_392275 [Aspergillus heteromorphus CBS 117.55]|uniref:Uncharacterized protein n=1 Tax=Aspergillus heteromorphus CBS 117.55 TaxID=1448321 RepID=A0A317X5K5_9EURO|nr:uncharacterized protein BO70DRAFT_392275 [Aspergillus heteromorphus CBS 117.55]PWY92902.1 hypothetical protein BO70DRAFT_392275 [Aspergillus heteromorphus CBS 117.55]
MQLSGLFVTAVALFASHIYAQSRPHGIDTGNELCTGECLPDPRHLPCSKPKSKLGDISATLGALGIMPLLPQCMCPSGVENRDFFAHEIS